ncbi:hypothetical protein, partial [Peribacillus sp. NPDC060253]|uniref:hypothetical protein n=1 Tax=Peribacillus sp. NPDC060253 TaxID=3347084 RepID=UPI003654F98D
NKKASLNRDTLAKTILLYTGPFDVPTWMQVLFLFPTVTFTYITIKNKSRFSFIIVSICSIVMFFSLFMHFVSYIQLKNKL